MDTHAEGTVTEESAPAATATVAETHEVKHEGSGGMPQLDPASFASQLFWLAVTFIVLYVFMARSIVPRIRGVIESREGQIQSDLDAAEQSRNEAAKARELYEKELISARAKASSLLMETQQQLEVHAVKTHHKLDLKLSDELVAAENSIKQQLQNVQGEVMPLVEELSALIVEKVTRVKPDANKVKAAINAVVKG